jgi:hypothetical protein
MCYRMTSTLALAAFSMAVAQSQILYETSFESPFTPGALGGQQGWATDLAGWFVAGTVGSVTPSSGNQMVQGNQGANNNYAYLTNGPSLWAGRNSWNQMARTGVDVFMPANVTGGDVGLSAWSPTLAFIGLAFLDPISNTMWINSPGTSWVNTNLAFSRDTWNRVELFLNYDTGTLRAALNGNLAAAAGSFSTATVLGTVEMTMFSTTTPATVFFDNYTFEAVPEPATMLALLGGVAGLALRRRKASGR